MANLVDVNEADFQETVLQASVPTLVDFWAEWCGPCRMMAPMLEKLAAAHPDALQVVKLNVETNVDLATQYAVMNIPTCILFVDGEPAKRLTGFMPLKKLERELAGFLS